MTHKNAIFAVIAIILLVSSSVLFMLDDRRNDAGAPEQTLASADFEFDSMKRSDGDRFFEFERTILSSELGIDLLFEDCGEYAYIYATAAVDDSRRSVSIDAHIYSGGKEVMSFSTTSPKRSSTGIPPTIMTASSFRMPTGPSSSAMPRWTRSRTSTAT